MRSNVRVIATPVQTGCCCRRTLLPAAATAVQERFTRGQRSGANEGLHRKWWS